MRNARFMFWLGAMVTTSAGLLRVTLLQTPWMLLMSLAGLTIAYTALFAFTKHDD